MPRRWLPTTKPRASQRLGRMLNAGQATVVTLGLPLSWRCAPTVSAAPTPFAIWFRQHLDDPAVPPARYAGDGISHHPPGPDRHGGDVRPEAPRTGDQGRPAPRRWSSGARPSIDNFVRIRAGPGNLQGHQFEVPAGHRVRWSGLRARASRPSPACCSVSTTERGASGSMARTSARSRRFPSRRNRHRPAGHVLFTTPSATTSPLWPLGGRRGGRGGGARANRGFHPASPPRASTPKWGARPQTLGRREATRRHRPHPGQGAADPVARRSDLGTRRRLAPRNGDPGRTSSDIRRTAPALIAQSAFRSRRRGARLFLTRA